MQPRREGTDATADDVNVMSEDLIAKALAAARARIARSERERAELDQAIAAAREEERLLLRLLGLRRGDVAQVGGADAPPGVPAPSPELAVGRGHPAVLAVIEELAAAGRPVHISELVRLLRRRGIPIPGAGTQANLITHLRRDARLVRPSRGMYGLSAWGLENMPAGLRQRRRKRLRVAATTSRKEDK